MALAATLAACAASHELPRPCGPDGGCRAGEACRATVDGELLCLHTCEYVAQLCPGGETCVNLTPGPEYVCWIGGPVPRRGHCTRTPQCARGLRCNRERVCEEACAVPWTCSTPGMDCEYGVCEVPVPTGAPCSNGWDCSPQHYCPPSASFTCQGSCEDRVCPDGRSCPTDDDDDCRSEVVAIDACERTAEGSVGCHEGQVCALTPLGVRRCMRSGCRPDGTGEVCTHACLTDPEDPTTLLCWLGGLVEGGEPCTTSHECRPGAACNAAGVCAPDCTTEGEPCPRVPGHVCRDFVCTPEG